MARVTYSYPVRKKSESGQDGTVTYDLPRRGFIPEILLTVFSTGTASTDMAIPASVQMTKVEILDGGTVVLSLTGNQIHGVSMFRGSRERASTETNEGGVEGYDTFRIILAGVFNGVNYAPDFGRFVNPQIQLTWNNTATTGPFGETYDADTSPAMKFTIVPKVVFDTTVYTHGYVMVKQIETFSSATSATKQIEIPRGLPLVGFYIEAGYVNTPFTEDVAQIKLDFDNGAWKPLDIYAEEVVALQKEWFGEAFSVSWIQDLKSGIEIDSHMGYPVSVNGVPNELQQEIQWLWASAHVGVKAPIILDSTGGGNATVARYSITSIGYLPYNLWYCPSWALLNGSGDLIDTSAYGRILIEIVQASALHTSSTPAVLAEFLVTG